jgi:transposase
MKKIEITRMSASGIEELLKSKEDYKIAGRLLSILPLAKGESSRKAQELLLLSHNQILIWAKRFNEQGIDGLKDKPKTGRKPKFTEEQYNWLKELVLYKSPTEFSYNTETWTAPILVDLIQKKINITYSDDMIYVILKKKLGLRHLKSKGSYPEKDTEKRAQFVETLKKNF